MFRSTVSRKSLWDVSRYKYVCGTWTRYACNVVSPEIAEIQEAMQALRCGDSGAKLAHVDEWTKLKEFQPEAALTYVEKERRAWEHMKLTMSDIQKRVRQERVKRKASICFEVYDAAHDAAGDLSGSRCRSEAVDSATKITKIIRGPNGYPQFIETSQSADCSAIVLLDAEDVARRCLPSQVNSNRVGFLSIVTAKVVESADKRFVVFLADTSDAANTFLGVRDVFSGEYWVNKGIPQCVVTGFEILESPAQDVLRLLITTKNGKLYELLLAPDGPRRIHLIDLNLKKTRDALLPAEKGNAFRPLRLTKSKDQAVVFVTQSVLPNNFPRTKPFFTYRHWILDASSLKNRRSLTTENEAFFEHWRGTILMFEKDSDSFSSIQTLKMNAAPGDTFMLRWKSAQFHISDVDCFERGCILYGWTEAGRPGLRTFHDDRFRKCYSVDFAHDGAPSVTLEQPEDHTSSDYKATRFQLPTSTVVANTPSLKPTVRPYSRRTNTIPFYGALEPDVNHLFDAHVASFSLSSMLIPELRYTVTFPSPCDSSNGASPSVSLVAAVRQNELPLLVPEHDVLSNSPKYIICRAHSPSEDGAYTIPLTIVRPVHGLLGGVDAGFETKGENTTDCVTRSHALNPNSTQKHLTLRPSEFHAASGIQPERWEDTEKNVDRKPNCLVLVYAASGTDPYLGFQEALIPLLKQHWVIVVAHCRGGAPHSVAPEWTEKPSQNRQKEVWECRSHWASLGVRANHWRSVHDLRDVCAFLIAEEFGKKGKIALRAGSAGAAFVASLLNTRHKDMIGCVVLESPFLDLVATMTDPKLILSPAEYIEWGNPTPRLKTLKQHTNLENLTSYFEQTESSFEESMEEASNEKNAMSSVTTCLNLLSLCPYTNIPDKIKQLNDGDPWILVSTPVDDTRVPYWHSVKWICRRRARNETSTYFYKGTVMPKTLLRVTESGRGGHAESCQLDDETANRYEDELVSFLLTTCS